MEAYSDIFGQLIEQEYTGDTDWKYPDRNLSNPKIKKYSKRYIGMNDDGGAHRNSTIISHTAYLMSKDNENKKKKYDAEFLLDYNQLAQLWYGSLEYLKKTDFMDFADCRWAIEESARDLIKNGVLLENNLKIIEQAFNEVSSNPTRRGLTGSMEIIKDKNTIVVPIEDETQSTEIVEITEVPTTPITTNTESITTIPKEANIYNGHSYMVYSESMTWKEAKEYCEKLGGHLVTISDADEQKFVEDLAEKFTDKTSYWLGGYYSDLEWKWVDGTHFSYTNWDSWTDGTEEYKQPDNHTGNEFYLRFANKKIQYSTWYSNKGKWNDVSNEADGSSGDVPLNSFGFICEWDSIAEISEDNNLLDNISSWSTEQIINSVNDYLKEKWCGENQYYCFESDLSDNGIYWFVCIRWNGSNSANAMCGSDIKINKLTGKAEISFLNEPYEWFNVQNYH